VLTREGGFVRLDEAEDLGGMANIEVKVSVKLEAEASVEKYKAYK